jgi:hypothetical protein
MSLSLYDTDNWIGSVAFAELKHAPGLIKVVAKGVQRPSSETSDFTKETSGPRLAQWCGPKPPKQSHTLLGSCQRPGAFAVGPFTITPILTNHAVFDAYMLLVEGKMGNVRLEHLILQKAFQES